LTGFSCASDNELFSCYDSCVCASGDLVGDDDIDSSPTFELIVEGEEAEEVELESRSTVTTSSVTEVEPVTPFANKRLRMNDSTAINITSVSDSSAVAVFTTGLRRTLFSQIFGSLFTQLPMRWMHVYFTDVFFCFFFCLFRPSKI